MLRIALIGRGPWAARYLAALRQLRGVRVTTVVSAGRPGKAFGGAVWLRDIRELRRGAVDAAIVASAAWSHASATIALLARGVPVLVEKPMALSVAAARRMHATARSQRALLCVAHTHLHSEAFEHLIAHVAAAGGFNRGTSAGGNLGPFRRDCTALWDYGSHDVAMFIALAGNPPVGVTANALEGTRPGQNFSVALKFSRAAERREAIAARSHPRAGPVEVNVTVGNAFACKRRWLCVDSGQDAFVYDDLAAERLTRRREGGPEMPIALPGRALPLTRTIEHFLSAVRRGKRYDPGAPLGVAVCGVLARCERQLTGRRWRRLSH
ncbi:MAG: Gfo/Idh/MocA family oxidoreductase [Pseudomonadota bacterium]